ncbi:hypothetical protein TPA2_gp73 [Tsukamurella phage TPA2]|uniref:hypothetical protein n=1 Tax=Tsukamurella phage TPA2 TaxID=981330 RepID=UPI0001FF8DE0|nr:hypothetical protein TPA2_gp73 [Tsukamurella phage TPA2]ADX31987.1 hypothetical protein [Tsukamurella phage TPA2]
MSRTIKAGELAKTHIDAVFAFDLRMTQRGPARPDPVTTPRPTACPSPRTASCARSTTTARTWSPSGSAGTSRWATTSR